MSSSILLGFRKSYAIVPVMIVLSIIANYIDNMLNGVKADKKNYIKTGLWAGAISVFIVYINTLNGNPEEILTGAPPF